MYTKNIKKTKNYAIFKKLYKGDHEKTSNQLNNIVYREMKQHEMAFKYFYESFEMSKCLLKTDHLNISASLKNKGVVYSDMKQHEMALKYHMESEEMRKRLLKINKFSQLNES